MLRGLAEAAAQITFPQHGFQPNLFMVFEPNGEEITLLRPVSFGFPDFRLQVKVFPSNILLRPGLTVNVA